MVRPRSGSQQANLLVVGDWVVDDHWVVGEHRSISGSRTGLRHVRALSDACCSVRSLCGAGQVATILHQATFSPRIQLRVYGVGIWHPNDREQLAQMLDPLNNVGHTPYQLARPIEEHREATALPADRMINLAENASADQIGTTRVIRLYEQVGGTLQLTRRVDWELGLSEKTRNELVGSLKSLKLPKSVTHIVVKDVRKGAVTPELIGELSTRFPNANWYLSSKAWKPRWLSKIPKRQVRLICVPQVAAAAAVRSDMVKVSAWVTASGEVSYDALKEMDALARDYENALIVVLPSDMTAIARAPAPDGTTAGWLIDDDSPSGPSRFVPMASVFFASLIAACMQFEEAGAEAHLKIAYQWTKRWRELEAKRLVERDWKPPREQRLTLDLAMQLKETYFKTFDQFDWERVKQDWVDSFTENNELLGVHQGTSPPSFEIWRAMTEVPGYVCSVRAKRKVLQSLLDQGKAFGIRGRRQHRSFMLVDTPGSGKSFLIKQLSKAIGGRLLEFNVTQLLGRHDLLHCFDTVVTSQAQEPEAVWIVFFDEINALLDRQHVYDAFLTPLEDGYYVREGNKFLIEPCLWIFAGTARPDTSVLEDKGSDFESRLTMPVFDLRCNTTDAKAQRSATIERVYTGIALVQALFPDVRYVSKAVLKALQMLPTNATPRDIRRLAKRIEYVRDGIVTADNLPERWFDLFPAAKEAAINPGDLRRRWAKILEDPDSKSLVEIRLGPLHHC